MPQSTAPDEPDYADPLWRGHTLPQELEQALFGFHTQWIRILPLDFSVLDAAAYRHLPKSFSNVEPPMRTMLTSGSVRYNLWSAKLGDLGAIQLRKLDVQRTECAILQPARPQPRELTAKEQLLVQSIAERSLRRETMLLIDEKRALECDAHHRWRCAVQAAMINYFFAQLHQEQQEDTATLSVLEPAQRNGGRPRKSSHQWAQAQIIAHGRDPREVYREWLAMDDNALLADPKDSFTKAIKPKKRK